MSAAQREGGGLTAVSIKAALEGGIADEALCYCRADEAVGYCCADDTILYGTPTAAIRDLN